MQFANLINGQWVEAAESRPNINPSDTSDVIGNYASGTGSDVDAAVDAAKGALPAWASASPQVRFDLLDAVGNAILKDKEAIGRMLSREEGKTLAEGIGETVRAAMIFKFFAGEALRIGGERLTSVRPGIEVLIDREPVGVIGIIAPWNFPIAIPAWKIAPALAYGNTVVMKPADLVPASSWMLAKLIHEAGCPKGVFNLVMGSGTKVGQRIVDHPGIHAISFTGSEDTGKRIGIAAMTAGKKVQLEMGGKNPLVVVDDADLNVAVGAAINGAFFSTGQRCTASSRIIVTEGIHDRFIEKFKAAAAALKVGNPLDAATQVGPVVDQKQLDNNLSYVAIAKSEGCDVTGGERIGNNGFFQQPAVFANATNSMRVSREEIFGPAASVIKVRDFDEALATANDTVYGLCAGICTTSLKLATAFRKQAKVGMVMVNLPTAGVDYHVPFGGTKGSSYGPREQGTYAREFYTTVKTAYIQP
jgi:alpha-ketoglutaric semialdehyde dehydrogenase